MMPTSTVKATLVKSVSWLGSQKDSLEKRLAFGLHFRPTPAEWRHAPATGEEGRWLLPPSRVPRPFSRSFPAHHPTPLINAPTLSAPTRNSTQEPLSIGQLGTIPPHYPNTHTHTHTHAHPPTHWHSHCPSAPAHSQSLPIPLWIGDTGRGGRGGMRVGTGARLAQHKRWAASRWRTLPSGKGSGH